MQFICCTGTSGCWLDIPRSFWGRDKDFIADLWVRDARRGTSGPRHNSPMARESSGREPPGIIKVATSDPITENEEGRPCCAPRRGRTCAPGIPITTHTPADSTCSLADRPGAGANPHRGRRRQMASRTCTSGTSATRLLDPDYHRELAELGVWLGWDINNPFGGGDRTGRCCLRGRAGPTT